MPPQTQPPLPSPRNRYTFSITALLVLTVLAAVGAAAGSYLWSAARGQPMSAGMFLAIVLIAPLGTAVALSVLIKLILKNGDSDTSSNDGPKRFIG